MSTAGAATPSAEQGDRGQTLAPFKNMSCTLLKAAQKSDSMIQ